MTSISLSPGIGHEMQMLSTPKRVDLLVRKGNDLYGLYDGPPFQDLIHRVIEQNHCHHPESIIES